MGSLLNEEGAMLTSVDVRNFLQDRDVPHEIFLVDNVTKTAKRAAALLRLPASEVAKSVLFMAEKNPVLTVVPGDRKVDLRKLRHTLKAGKIHLAPARRLRDLTGYLVGATPPLAHRTEITIVIDERLMEHEVVYTAGGQHNAMLKIRPRDLKSAACARTADISDELNPAANGS